MPKDNEAELTKLSSLTTAPHVGYLIQTAQLQDLLWTSKRQVGSYQYSAFSMQIKKRREVHFRQPKQPPVHSETSNASGLLITAFSIL